LYRYGYRYPCVCGLKDAREPGEEVSNR